MTGVLLGPLDPATYLTHPLHRVERAWMETNCYADLWIEVLHALGAEPVACLAFTLALDFEGDQWTFFKPPLTDLNLLYGIDVQELNLWRPLPDHVAEQVERGRLVLAEVDAFYLPDTRATDYQTQHTKTTIGIHTVNVAQKRLGYFHNAGYHALEGEDFAGLFKPPAAPEQLPPYVEFAKLDRFQRLSSKALLTRALKLTREHLARRPGSNPVGRFAPRFLEDLERLKSGALPSYHTYAFATIRQLGAGFELAAHFLRWLEQQGEPSHTATVEDFESISQSAKAMILKAARAVATRKSVDFTALFSSMEAAWDSGMERLSSRYPP